MANIKSAAKRARQAVKRGVRNSSILTGLKTAQKKFQKALAAGDAKASKAAQAGFSSALDKAAKLGVIHKNSASRRKSASSRALKPASA